MIMYGPIWSYSYIHIWYLDHIKLSMKIKRIYYNFLLFCRDVYVNYHIKINELPKHQHLSNLLSREKLKGGFNNYNKLCTKICHCFLKKKIFFSPLYERNYFFCRSFVVTLKQIWYHISSLTEQNLNLV